MYCFDPNEWFQIDIETRAYLRKLLNDEMSRHEYSSDEYRRASRLCISLIAIDIE